VGRGDIPHMLTESVALVPLDVVDELPLCYDQERHHNDVPRGG
jgi:hypothetical protein